MARPPVGRSSDPLESDPSSHRYSELRLRRPPGEEAALEALRSTVPPPYETERSIPVAAPLSFIDEHPVSTPHAIVLPLSRSPDRAMLTILEGQGEGGIFTLAQGSLSVGRGPGVDIPLVDPSISRLHARIEHDDAAGAYYVVDLGSTNGTFVGGRPVKRERLCDGDRLQLGSCALRFSFVDEHEELLQRRLYEASMRDPLTGLANRRCLFERLARAVERARRGASDLAVLMLDVDHLKGINDRFGHEAGDQVLRAVALAGGSVLRSGELFARYGGEELAVLVPDTEAADVAVLAERLRERVATLEVEVGGGAVTPTVSVGGALLSECAIKDGLELFARADARLYAAKSGGRNCVVVAR